MRDNHIPKPRIVIEVDLAIHNKLKTVASYYGASVRGTIVRYVRDGLAADERRMFAGTPDES